MSSMTDVVFLLLIFFMVTSTMVVQSALKVTLPQSSQQAASRPMTRVTIDKDLNYFVAIGEGEDEAVTFEEIGSFLEQAVAETPEMFVALYADELVPYREIVRVLNLAVENNYQMVLATRPMDRK